MPAHPCSSHPRSRLTGGCGKRQRGGPLFLLLLSLAALGCASAPGPVATAPGPVPQAPPSAPAEAGSEPAVEEVPAPSKEAPPLTVVIDPGDSSGGPSLIEASRAAKEMRKNAQPPIAVITNDNLSDYASRGKLTIVTPEAGPATEGEAESPAGEAAGRGELYWRERARELRLLWRRAVDATSELTERAEALRLQFYSEDNRFVRDTQVKPTWDRVLDRLEDARRDADLYREDLAAFLEQGRKAGALPGWLREGIELEPAWEAEPGDDLDSQEPIEPPVVDDGRPRP